MVMFNELKQSRNEKVDLIKMALNNYTSPYKVSGYDASTLNNLTEFISSNILYKKRKDYSENDLSDMMYKYAYRYFTQFVTPNATLNMIEMMINYNRYMTFNIAENSMLNMFGLKETFKYQVVLFDDNRNVNHNSSKTYSFSVPYISGDYRDNLEVKFTLNDNQFSIDGKIMNINKSSEGFVITTDFELKTKNNNVNIRYNLLANDQVAAQLEITQLGNRSYTLSGASNNIAVNITSEMTKIINNLYISAETEDWMVSKGIITAGTTKDKVLNAKKQELIQKLEKIKSDNILNDIVVSLITKYAQDKTHEYKNTTTGIHLWTSKMAEDIANHIRKEIKHTGIGIDEMFIIFGNSTSTYEGINVSTQITTFETFLNDLFRWTISDETTTLTRLTDFNIDASKYFVINSTGNNDDSSSFVTYKNTIEETLITHVYTHVYKYYILMDIKSIEWNNSVEKDRVINEYEINQVSDNQPIVYINVVHRTNSSFVTRLENLVTLLRINNNGTPPSFTGNRMLSLTFQYKELNRDVREIFMQDQVETIVANWLVKNGSIASLFNSIYINNFNESAWDLAKETSINSLSINETNDINYFNRAVNLIANPINFREKDYMDIVGYYLDSYNDTYYGMNSEQRQEIALFIRSFQDVRDYYFKNILLKALVNSDMYPLYEYILLVTMALDRYFNKKVSKHKELDTYNSEDIDKFLDSFGLSELNKYDNFYGSFDYKMSVIRNYNNLIKNKGTRRVRGLIEEMLNDSSNEYDIKINEYYIAKSTKNSIKYVDEWYHDGWIYKWGTSSEPEGVEVWAKTSISIENQANSDPSLWANNRYEWYNVSEKIKYTYIYNTDTETIDTIKEAVNIYDEVPTESPTKIGLIQYTKDNDVTLFINVPEGTDRPITSVKNKIESNVVVGYDEFIKDDLYWSKDIKQKFINSADGLGLNYSKTKYLSISASINMEVAKIMNMYIMSILDNISEKMSIDLSIESYSDDYISVSNIKYQDLVKYIKFMTSHLGDLLDPWTPEPSQTPIVLNFYGVPSMDDMADRLTSFEIELKEIISGITDEEREEFMKDKVSAFADGQPTGDRREILSMNRYAYETDIDNIKKVNGIDAGITSRLDGSLQIGKDENGFTKKLRRLLLGFGYSSVDFQNSAIFVIDLLESTNLLSIMEGSTEPYTATKTKYLKLLSTNNTSSQSLNISNLYVSNLRSLLQMLKDYTENRIYREDYTLKDSLVTNTLAINSAFVKIMELVIRTFFERPNTVYEVEELEDLLTAETFVEENTVVFEKLPEFMKDFITVLRRSDISYDDRILNMSKYNSILNSMNTILSFMTSSNEYELLRTVNTNNKNFSDAEYLNFLISLLSFFMSYKVTLYEESHQFDLSNPRETLLFAEDLHVWSEVKIEEDWFFDEEIMKVEV